MDQNLTRTRAQLAADFLDLVQLYSVLYNRCSREQLLWRPLQGVWSVAECIEHVALTNSQYLASMRTAVESRGNQQAAGNDIFSPGGRFSAGFLKRIGPGVTSKFKASGKTRPLSVDPGPAFEELCKGHSEIQEFLHGTTRVDLNRIRFKNPFIPVLRFTVATGLLVMAAHERRHLLQAERVTRAEGFPQNKAQQSA